jgi:hypothetical protein
MFMVNLSPFDKLMAGPDPLPLGIEKGKGERN